MSMTYHLFHNTSGQMRTCNHVFVNLKCTGVTIVVHRNLDFGSWTGKCATFMGKLSFSAIKER